MKEEGVYCCIVCENVLFHSQQKYHSGCGWPSFSDVIAQGKVTVSNDTTHCKHFLHFIQFVMGCAVSVTCI